MPGVLSGLSVTVMTGEGYPEKVVRVTSEQGGLAALGKVEDLLVEARKHNPELGLDGLVQGIIRLGVADLAKQLKAGKVDQFLKNRRR